MILIELTVIAPVSLNFISDEVNAMTFVAVFDGKWSEIIFNFSLFQKQNEKNYGNGEIVYNPGYSYFVRFSFIFRI